MALFVASQLETVRVMMIEPTAVKETDWTTARTIAVLPKGAVYDVYECDDVKSYFLYKIRLADGRFGYVGNEPTLSFAALPAWRDGWTHPVVWDRVLPYGSR